MHQAVGMQQFRPIMANLQILPEKLEVANFSQNALIFSLVSNSKCFKCYAGQEDTAHTSVFQPSNACRYHVVSPLSRLGCRVGVPLPCFPT